ncbi:erythromycin esterase family protein [Arthrobacter silvisoli]|uniref:erythromycin esterase family protein n=1 Tax=Arthrobacter silvisoli TaxID=2291022 RepID=UPI000E2156C3|nr:erythromycin esterase family protein [Arthrobacter silvisoli]
MARPLLGPYDLDDVVRSAAAARFVCLGEASHGSHEFYRWRALLSRRLIEEHGFTWIGVEGDWPDCWRINRWVRGQADQELDARELLAGFSRWPTWMWANVEVAGFLEWLRQWNLALPEGQRTGFYGLDVYSLWDSLRVIFAWLHANAREAVPAALRAWQCFAPFGEDPQRYAWNTRLVPQSCEADVLALLAEVRRQTFAKMQDDPAAFDVAQNAIIAANAERYYRIMVRGDRQSWNIRDQHMSDTIDRIADRHGHHSKGLIWAHNTHVGDARATDMEHAGMVNIGQLMRQRHPGTVFLVGFATFAGTVMAAEAWGRPGKTMLLPPAQAGSHEYLLNQALDAPSSLLFGASRPGEWPDVWLGHRAIGVVYNPEREGGNYVPTELRQRYDALLWFPRTVALHPLHPEYLPGEPELETEPTGF